MEYCPFCDPNNKRTRTIKTGTLSSIILSNPRLMPGHSLVIPTRHVEVPWELKREELLEIFTHIWWVEQRLIGSGLATGCDIRQNYRPFTPQSRLKVNHLHFHVLPRTNEDELYKVSMHMERDVFKDLTDDECEQVSKRVLND